MNYIYSIGALINLWGLFLLIIKSFIFKELMSDTFLLFLIFIPFIVKWCSLQFEKSDFDLTQSYSTSIFNDLQILNKL